MAPVEDKIYSYGKGYNRYASDRIAASLDTLRIDKLEGGSVAPGGPVMVEGLSYKCHSNQEHLPLRAFITDTRLPIIADDEGSAAAQLNAKETSIQIMGATFFVAVATLFL